MEVKRATYEQVNNAQLEFIFGNTGLDKLIELRETVAPESRRTYFDNLAISLVGIGRKYNVKLSYNGGIYEIGTISSFARKMAYMTDTDDKKQEITLKGRTMRIPIHILWKALRESMYEPMDEALTLALTSSAEIFRGGGGVFEFDSRTHKTG